MRGKAKIVQAQFIPNVKFSVKNTKECTTESQK